jgi:hypothetical protein
MGLVRSGGVQQSLPTAWGPRGRHSLQIQVREDVFDQLRLRDGSRDVEPSQGCPRERL